jgi:Ca2+-binding RTX toxin-like protein
VIVGGAGGDVLDGDIGNDTVIVTAIDITLSPNNPQPQPTYSGDTGFDTLKIVSIINRRITDWNLF